MTLAFDLIMTLTLDFSRSNFDVKISGIVRLIDVK